MHCSRKLEEHFLISAAQSITQTCRILSWSEKYQKRLLISFSRLVVNEINNRCTGGATMRRPLIKEWFSMLRPLNPPFIYSGRFFYWLTFYRCHFSFGLDRHFYWQHSAVPGRYGGCTSSSNSSRRTQARIQARSGHTKHWVSSWLVTMTVDQSAASFFHFHFALFIFAFAQWHLGQLLAEPFEPDYRTEDGWMNNNNTTLWLITATRFPTNGRALVSWNPPQISLSAINTSNQRFLVRKAESCGSVYHCNHITIPARRHCNITV